MKKTFAELGIPFPLFEASIDQCREYDGTGTCQVCAETERHLFRVGIGGYLTMPCPSCGERIAFHVASDGFVLCGGCSAEAQRPATLGQELQACSECLRAGRVILTKDTSYGMVSWDQLCSGVTQGVPGLNRESHRMPDVELVQTAPAEEQFGEMQPAWYGARIPHETLEGLLRTPDFASWQGERWFFDGLKPMIFVGSWTQEDFNRHAADGDGRALFLEAVSSDENDWIDLGRGSISAYVFRSQSSAVYRGYYDMD